MSKTFFPNIAITIFQVCMDPNPQFLGGCSN